MVLHTMVLNHLLGRIPLPPSLPPSLTPSLPHSQVCRPEGHVLVNHQVVYWALHFPLFCLIQCFIKLRCFYGNSSFYCKLSSYLSTFLLSSIFPHTVFYVML